MKCVFIALVACVLSINLFSQEKDELEAVNEKRGSLTFGFLEGGGSFFGLDLEFMITDHLSSQIGIGAVGFGAGLNYHIKERINSSFFSLQYWNQGVGSSFVQNAISLNYVFRTKKWFTCQLGLGKPLMAGPAFPVSMEQPSVMLMYAIGGYIPF